MEGRNGPLIKMSHVTFPGQIYTPSGLYRTIEWVIGNLHFELSGGFVPRIRSINSSLPALPTGYIAFHKKKADFIDLSQ